VRFYWVRRYRWLKMHGIDEAAAGYDQAVRPPLPQRRPQEEALGQSR
jgi:hypothetical protein